MTLKVLCDVLEMVRGNDPPEKATFDTSRLVIDSRLELLLFFCAQFKRVDWGVENPRASWLCALSGRCICCSLYAALLKTGLSVARFSGLGENPLL